jgi:DNA-binding HxlR family transcriptional regulator
MGTWKARIPALGQASEQQAQNGDRVTFRCLSMNSKVQAMSTTPKVARMVEDIVGCKWSLAVLGAVRGGVCRPGAMEHAIEGLSKKVLNERLNKLVRFGILEKRAYPELPPRVEYRFTPFGDKFLGVLDDIDALQREIDR